MKTVAVQADIATAAIAGLFGLLGDAWVKIIDVDEGKLIRAYYDMAESQEQDCEALKPQELTRRDAGFWKRQLEISTKRVFHLEGLVAATNPAIMFRLCTNRCNALNKDKPQAIESSRANGRVPPWLVP